MPFEERLGGALPRFAGVAAWVSIVVGGSVLVGWILDVPFLKSVAPGLVSMKANAAIGFVLAGTSLLLLRDERPTGARRLTACALSGVIAALAALTITEYILGVDLRIDHLFSDPDARSSNPGRASPHTAIAFLAVGLWLTAIAQQHDQADRIRNWLSVIACLVVLQAMVGYLFGVNYLYGISAVTGMAVHTIATFVILCLGILAARPKQGLMGLLTSAGTGGHVVRRLTPAVLLVPLVIGYLRLKGQQHGLFGTRDGIAILAGTTIVLFGAIVVYTGRSLNDADAERLVLEARLRELAERDPLTSLFNRRRFDEELESQLARARRYGTSVALITIDVDGLKQVNDTYGHRAGDELLIGVATMLATKLRAADITARVGGDEFAALLPNVEPEGAEAAAAKLIETMRARSWEVAGQTIASTISAGIAVTGGAPPDATTLSAQADQALYQAKEAGGDHYAVALPDSVPALD